MEPESSWILVRFITTELQWALPLFCHKEWPFPQTGPDEVETGLTPAEEEGPRAGSSPSVTQEPCYCFYSPSFCLLASLYLKTLSFLDQLPRFI